MASTKYMCIKCGSGATGASHPLVGNCTKGGGHQWVAEDGIRRNYKCIKCGSGQTTNSHPLLGKCTKGGEHDWKA